MSRDLIFAKASGSGVSGVSLLRVSGQGALDLAKSLTGYSLKPRHAHLRKILGGDGRVLDEALVIGFEAGASFTGEEILEVQCHGSFAVEKEIMQRFQDLGCRLAAPGEFTRRAMMTGRLTLSEVEGLGDLLLAETEAQRAQAMKLMSGDLQLKVDLWRKKLLEASALFTVVIDFSDEEIPSDIGPEIKDILSDVLHQIEREIEGHAYAERIRDGFTIAFLGAPNSGKSTLMNVIAKRELAITSPIPGTTRDILECRIDLDGMAVTILDMAGLRKTDDAIESIGVDRAISRARDADIRVFFGLNEFINLDENSESDILIAPKSDIAEGEGLPISALTGDGVDALIAKIRKILKSRTERASISNNLRHKKALTDARARLKSALSAAENYQEFPELVEEEIRATLRALSFLVGVVDIEHVLDEVFSRFCLGK